MMAQVLPLKNFKRDDGYSFPLSDWAIEKELLPIHRAPIGLNALLVGEFGETELFIRHCVTLSRVLGVLTDDFRDLFAAISAQFGPVAWSDPMAQTISKAIECPGLRKQANETLRNWKNLGQTNHATLKAYEGFSRALMARHADAWCPRNTVLKHAVLLIEAARHSRWLGNNKRHASKEARDGSA
jgi:hypothetical protein